MQEVVATLASLAMVDMAGTSKLVASLGRSSIRPLSVDKE
jgi:hypothetical protein